MTVAGLAAEQASAQAIIDGASNAADLTLATTYTLEDSLANLAAAEDGVVANAGSYTLSNEAGDLGELTEAEQALVEGAENAADYEFAPEGAGLTQALTELQTANAGVATAAKALNDAAEDNDALTAGYEASAAGVEAARTDAQAAVDKAQSELTNKLETTVADTDPDGALYAATSKHLGSTQELTEANLNTAKAGIQGEIDAATTVFTEDGTKVGIGNSAVDLDNVTDGENDTSVDQVLDLSTVESGDIDVNLASFNDTNNNKNDNGAGGSDTIVLPDFAEYTGTLTLDSMNIGNAPGADTLVATDLAGQFASIEVSSSEATESRTDGNGYLDITLTSAAGGKLVLENFIKGETFADQYADGDVDFTDSQLGEFIANLNGDSNASDVNGTVDDADAATTIEVPALTVEKFAGLLENTYGSLKANASTSGLEKVGFTLADLQDAAQGAAAELSTARAVESDADLLGDVAGAINAHIGAGGDNVDVDQTHTLLSLRGDINDALTNAEADFTLDGWLNGLEDTAVLGSEDLGRIANGHVADLIRTVLATGDKDTGTVNDNGVVTVDATEAEAPTSGEGTWVKGDEVEGEDTYTFTYEPSAEEQALIDTFESLEARASNIVEASETEEAFNEANTTGDEDATLGAQLDAIEGQLKALADAEETLTDALADQTAAEEVIGGLEAAVAEQDAAEQWFEDNGYELPVSVDSDVSGTAENDIFLFDEDASADAAIGNFGTAGEDQLFFGEGFTLVTLEDNESITDKVGDVATQEIFWEQNGNNVELYVENETFAGNGSSEADLTQVTLTGVTGADLQDNLANGTLTAGTAADIA